MQLTDALTQIDGMLDLVSALVVQNEPETLEPAVRQLRDGMQAFAGLGPMFGREQFTPAAVQRMQAMSERMTQMRGHLARAAAINAQQLAALLPEQAAMATYGSGRMPGSAASVARMYHVSG